jgi:hypothetical protein
MLVLGWIQCCTRLLEYRTEYYVHVLILLIQDLTSAFRNTITSTLASTDLVVKEDWFHYLEEMTIRYLTAACSHPYDAFLRSSDRLIKQPSLDANYTGMSLDANNSVLLMPY